MVKSDSGTFLADKYVFLTANNYFRGALEIKKIEECQKTVIPESK
jgi:hypothetical protein